MKKKTTQFLFCFLMLLIGMANVQAVYNDNNVGSYETELARFPASYQDKIKQLHQIYPNAVFVAQDRFLTWSGSSCAGEVAVPWNAMLNAEVNTSSSKNRSLINTKDGYKSTATWSYSYYTNKFNEFGGKGWYAANDQTVAYYLDPRNFLTERNVFMFASLYYSSQHKVEDVESILKNSFMASNEKNYIEYYDTSGNKQKLNKTYAQIIMEAGKKYNLNVYFLASRLVQEQGRNGTSPLISGNYGSYKGYYNYFNISAAGNTDSAVINNGLNYAKSKNWTNPEIAIVEGSKFLYDGYVGVNDKCNVRGQMTNYLQKWDPYGPKLGGHQYMQNIVAPISEASIAFNAYAAVPNYKNLKYIFHIPVYQNMPNSTSLPNPGNPNNYLKTLKVEGSQVNGFDGAKSEYTYNVSGSTTSIYIEAEAVTSGTSTVYVNGSKGSKQVNLTGTSQVIPIQVVAGNGATKNYKLTVYRSDTTPISVGEIIKKIGKTTDGTYLGNIALNTTEDTLKKQITDVASGISVNFTRTSTKGNTNKLATNDQITIKSGTESKTYRIVLRGDVNGDGNINAQDYVQIKNYIMGSKTLTSAFYQAADVDKNGKPNAQDYVKVKNYIMGSGSISQ